jgi:hypothetical protein
MNMFRCAKILSALCIAIPVFAQTEVIVDYKDSLPVLNEQLRRANSRLQKIESASAPLLDTLPGIVPVASGGTGDDFSAVLAGDIFYFSDTGEVSTAPIDSLITFPTQYLNLVSTTTVTNAQSSGNIAISKDKDYVVYFQMRRTSAQPPNNVLLSFNNPTASKIFRRDINLTPTTPTETTAAGTGAGDIALVPVSGGTILMSNGTIQGRLNFSTHNLNNERRIAIDGEYLSTRLFETANLHTHKLNAMFQGSADVTHYTISLGGSDTTYTGVIWTYEIVK